jgi:hypothetical protein
VNLPLCDCLLSRLTRLTYARLTCTYRHRTSLPCVKPSREPQRDPKGARHSCRRAVRRCHCSHTPRADVVVSCRCCCLPLHCQRLRLVPGSTVETLASPDGAELGSYQRPQNDLTSLDPPPPHPPRSSSSTPSTLSRALLSLPTPARQRVCSRRLLLGLRPIPNPRPITSSAALARHGCHDLCPRHPRHAHRHQDPVPRPDQEAQAAPQGPRRPCPSPQGTLSLLQARQPHSAALATARC